jgi:hypothetical protein
VELSKSLKTIGLTVALIVFSCAEGLVQQNKSFAEVAQVESLATKKSVDAQQLKQYKPLHTGTKAAQGSSSIQSLVARGANDVMRQNEALIPDSYLNSRNGIYYLRMQSDGNLVLYQRVGSVGRYRFNAIWSSRTDRRTVSWAVMQADGNLVLYSRLSLSPRYAVWASGSNGRGTPPYYLIVQNDGNVVIYDRNNRPIWATNTNR